MWVAAKVLAQQRRRAGCFPRKGVRSLDKCDRRDQCHLSVFAGCKRCSSAWMDGRWLSAVTPRAVSGSKPAVSLRLIPRVKRWRPRLASAVEHREFTRGQELHDWSPCNVDANGNYPPSRLQSASSSIFFSNVAYWFLRQRPHSFVECCSGCFKRAPASGASQHGLREPATKRS